MSIINLSDQELVAQYLNTGGARYFAQIYIRHRQDVYKKCLYYTGNSDDSEDFVQDIFMRLTLKLDSYKGEAKFTTWLHTVTTNYCIDQLRKQQHAKTLWHTYVRDSDHASDWGTLSDESHFQAFELMLSQLSQNQRELLLSKYKAGIRIKDIASSHDLTPSAVKMRIKRAREYARNLYDKILSEGGYL